MVTEQKKIFKTLFPSYLCNFSGDFEKSGESPRCLHPFVNVFALPENNCGNRELV